MNDFNQKLYSLGLQEVIERYLKHYFDLHGDILPIESKSDFSLYGILFSVKKSTRPMLH